MNKVTPSLEYYCPIQYQPIKPANYEYIFWCRIDPNISAEYFREVIMQFPSVIEHLAPNVLPSVPFEPLQIAGAGVAAIPNKRVLTTRDLLEYSLPASLGRTGSLMYDPYVPRFRLYGEDDDFADEDLPNYAQSYRTRYDFSAVEKIEKLKGQIFEYDTLRQAWRFKLFQASAVLLNQLNMPLDVDIIQGIILEHPYPTKFEALHHTLVNSAEEIAAHFIGGMSDEPDQYEQSIRVLDDMKQQMMPEKVQLVFGKLNIHFKQNRPTSTRQLTDSELAQYHKFIERARYYLTRLRDFGKLTIPTELHDQLYVHEKAIATQIFNQQQEIFVYLQEQSHALSVIKSVTHHIKKPKQHIRHYQNLIPPPFVGSLCCRHPNMLPDTFFYDNEAYKHHGSKIITSHIIDDALAAYLAACKRVAGLFNRPWPNYQKTAYYLSQFHGFGLFSLFDSKEDEQVAEYCGELIGTLLSEVRDKTYMESGLQQIYMFQLREDIVIDATFIGSYARFLNHCCQPSCISYSMFFSKGKLVPNNKRLLGESHGVGMFGIVKLGQEITINYNLSKASFEHKLSCNCGSSECSGAMN